MLTNNAILTIKNRIHSGIKVIELLPAIDALLTFDEAFGLQTRSGMIFLSLTTLTEWCICLLN